MDTTEIALAPSTDDRRNRYNSINLGCIGVSNPRLSVSGTPGQSRMWLLFDWEATHDADSAHQRDMFGFCLEDGDCNGFTLPGREDDADCVTCFAHDLYESYCTDICTLSATMTMAGICAHVWADVTDRHRQTDIAGYND